MLLEVVVTAFVLTQCGYAVVNCGLLALYLRRPTNVVDERTLGRVLEASADSAETRDSVGASNANTRTDAYVDRARMDGGRAVASDADRGADVGLASDVERGADIGVTPRVEADPGLGLGPQCRLPATLRRPIHVFVPLVDDRWGSLEATLASVAAQSYPTSLVSVTVAYEPSETDAPALEGAIDAQRPPELAVETLAVDVDARVADRSGERAWWVTGAGTGASPTTAALLTAAFESRSIADDDLVTVLEAGSWLPVDAFELAVAGLEEYDIVQAKRTVRDVDAGALPLLESMATAARSDLCRHSSAGPYHLLESGYVAEAQVLEAAAERRRADTERQSADGERRESNGDDSPRAHPLGPAAARQGYTLGVVDRYVRAPCPADLESWLAGNRERTRDLYRGLFARGWTGVDDLRCWSGTVLLHALALLAVVGLPAAALVAVLSAGGVTPLSSPVVQALVAFNGLVWIYYSVRAYRSAWAAIPFRSRSHRLAYSLLSNPLSQALYAMLWAAPLYLGLRDAVRGTSAVGESPHR